MQPYSRPVKGSFKQCSQRKGLAGKCQQSKVCLHLPFACYNSNRKHYPSFHSSNDHSNLVREHGCGINIYNIYLCMYVLYNVYIFANIYE